MKKALLLALIAGTAQASTISLPVSYTLPLQCAAKTVTPTLAGFDADNNVQGIITVAATCIGHLAHGATYRYAYNQSSPVTWDFNGAYIGSYNAPLSVPAATPQLAVDALGNSATVTGAAVTLTVVSPPAIVPVAAIVPNVEGLTLAQADGALSAWSLLPSLTVNYSVPYPRGTIFNQLPASGTVVPFGTYVSIWERN